MAIDITTIGVGVDTAKLKAGTRELDSFGKSADTASRKADNLTSNTQKLGKESTVATAALGRMVPALAAVLSVGSLARTIDEYTKFTAQLKLATRSQTEYATALSDVNRIANTAQASLSSIGTLYARLNNALRDVGVSQAQVGKITENVGLALKVSGATASESASAMLQLSQAFGSGVLRGEEFNAVNEAAPALMRALAESIGVPIGALRELATDGKLTADVLAKAFGDENLLNKFREQAKEVQTLSGAWQGFKNKFVTYIGEMDKAVGASKYLAKLLNFTGELLFPGERKLSPQEQAAANQKELDFLSKKGALGVRENTRLEKLAELRKKMGITGNQIGGLAAITGGGSYAPNFSAGVEAQNVEEIHRHQEEALRIQKDANKKYQDDRKKVQDAVTAQRLSAIEHEYTVEANSMASMLDKKALVIKEEQKLKEAAYKEDLKRINFLQDVANDNYKEAQKSFADAEKEKLREFEKTVDGFRQLFREGFAGMINGGTGSWKAFTKQTYTQFKTAVADKIYKLLAEPFVVKILASLAGIGVSGGSSGNAVFKDGIMQEAQSGLMGSIKDLSSNIQGGLTGSIEKLGAFFANGSGGIGDSIGGFLGQYAGSIANYAPYAGAFIQAISGDLKGAAFTAAGAAIGSIIPGVGTAIGAVVGSLVGSLFGGKKIPMVGSQASGSFTNGAYTGTTAKFGKKDIGLQSSLGQITEAFTSTLGGFLKEYGLNDNVSAGATFRSRTNVRGFFDSSFEGGSTSFGTKYGKAKGDNVQAGFQQYIDTVLGSTLVEAIQKSKLPDGIKKFFDGVVDKAVVLDTINTLVGFKNAMKDLPDVFKAVQNAMDTTAYTTSIAQLKAQFAAVQTFTGLFYTQEEQFATFTAQLSTQLESLNKVLPTSRDEYRAWVDGMNVVDGASRDQFNGLIALAPAMDAYFKQLQQQADGINEVNKALADGLDANLYSTYANYASAQASTANGINASSFMGERSFTNQISTELIAETKALRENDAKIVTLLEAIAISTNKTARTQKQWNDDGLPAERVM